MEIHKLKKKICMRKFWLIALILLVPFMASCGAPKKAIQIKGSDTMVNLAQGWAEAFMLKNPDIAIAVTGGGSGTGMAALISNTCSIAQSSREIKNKEIEMAEKRGVEPKEFIVANDGIALIAHPSNPIAQLTIQQLSDIYTGKIKNWKELKGPNQKIVALSRDRNSGTHVFFLEEVVKLGNKKSLDEFAADVLMMPSSQAVIEEVSSNPEAIGYVGLGYVTKSQKILAVAKNLGSPYIFPTIETVKTRKYPISRSLLFYTNGNPQGQLKSFFDFVLSKEGQQIVLDMDFIPAK